MSAEMEHLLDRLDFYNSQVSWLRGWNDEIEDIYARHIGQCEREIYEALATIDELEQAIAIESIVRLCLTGE